MNKLLAALVAGAFMIAQSPIALADKHMAGEKKTEAKKDDKKAEAKKEEKKAEAKKEEKKAEPKKDEKKKKKGGC